MGMPLPLTLVTEVTYKLRKLFGVPIGLEGSPCVGPVVNTTLGQTRVTGFGWLDKYLTALVNDAIRDQRLLVDPLDSAVNAELHKLQPKCDFNASRATAAPADLL